MQHISFVTNSTRKDYLRLKYFIPAALKVFGDRISEFLIVLETKAEEGRIAAQHSSINNIDGHILSDDRIELIKSIDSRIRFIKTDYNNINDISQKYFNEDNVIRCQTGTPIFAFLYGIENAKEDLIFRADCDVIFYDNGFINNSLNEMNNFDVIQPPLLKNRSTQNFTTRAFFINRKRINKKFPLTLHKLDVFRRFHRKLFGRATVHSLEEIFYHNSQQGKLDIKFLSSDLGNTMHICTREEFALENIPEVIDNFTNGNIPIVQKNFIDNFNINFWVDFTKLSKK
jgi:hypothetical protein